ncbi:MAG: SIMPL domain-containing protein [Actinomycetota bacterium]|nr:SIMPL domain-containing protein [Actinomycetota bacterium]
MPTLVRPLFVVPATAAAIAAAYLVGTAGGTSPAGAVARAAAAVTGNDHGIVVTGLGRVSGVPDVLRATLGVDVRGADVTAALRAANSAQTKVTTAVVGDGVSERDVQTSDVSLNQTFDTKGRPDGYQVSERIVVKLREMAKAGKVLGDAVTAGGQAARLDGVSFALEDNVALLAKAREAAYGEARDKAQKYASLAGRSLGPLELVSEVQSDPLPVQSYAASAPMAGPAATVPLSPGQSEVSVSVTVRWALA